MGDSDKDLAPRAGPPDCVQWYLNGFPDEISDRTNDQVKRRAPHYPGARPDALQAFHQTARAVMSFGGRQISFVQACALEAAVVFKPETLVRWHRSGFRLYWRCKSRRRVGRPAVPADIRDLIRTISHDNPLWGAPRIHGELLKLGIDIAQSTVAKYMSRRHGPRSPGWQAFLRNHTAHIAGIDLFVVPTIGFKLLYGLVTGSAAATARLDQCDSKSNRRVDRPADHRSIPVG